MIQITGMSRADMKAIIDLEELADLPDKIGERWLKGVYVANTTIDLVAWHGTYLAGYVILKPHDKVFELVRFVVDKDYRRQGVGRRMMDNLKLRAANAKQRDLELVARDDALDLHLFLKSQGFFASHSTYRNCFGDGIDGYRFIFPGRSHHPSSNPLARGMVF